MVERHPRIFQAFALAISLLALAGCVGKGKAPNPAIPPSAFTEPPKIENDWSINLRSIKMEGVIHSSKRSCTSGDGYNLNESRMLEAKLRSALSENFLYFSEVDEVPSFENVRKNSNHLDIETSLIDPSIVFSAGAAVDKMRTITLHMNLAIKVKVRFRSGHRHELAFVEPIQIEEILDSCSKIEKFIKVAVENIQNNAVSSLMKKLKTEKFNDATNIFLLQ